MLLVTNREDVTADLVVLEMRKRGVSYLRLNTEDFPQRVGLTLQMNRNWDGYLDGPKGQTRLEAIHSVWYRRPVSPVIASEVTEPEVEEFARTESESALRNLWHLLDCYWISPLPALRRAEHKLLQLREASRLGLEVPPTLVSTSPAETRSFLGTYPRAVVKALGRGTVRTGSGQTLAVFTERLTLRSPEDAERARLAPALVQAEVPRSCDLRVTVVRRQVFAAEIHRKPEADGVDWRRDDPRDLVHRTHRLAASLEAKLVKLVASLGLEFGAVDLIIRPDGGYTFLEVNPNGQWAWIELELGLPISVALVDALLRVGEGRQAVPVRPPFALRRSPFALRL